MPWGNRPLGRCLSAHSECGVNEVYYHSTNVLLESRTSCPTYVYFSIEQSHGYKVLSQLGRILLHDMVISGSG